VYNLEVKQVEAHSSHMIDSFLDHVWARVGEHIDRLHHRYTESTMGI
jgi:hypothetical protein